MQVKFLDLQAINKSYGQDLINAATDVVRSGWYLHGTETERFEAEWGAYCNSPHAVGVGNGLDGLRAVLQAWKIMYGWRDGDEVIVPANTFIATPLAVSQTGLKPVFCDVNRDDALICTDTAYLESLLTEKTRCIIPVHLYGQLANLIALYDFAGKHGLQILEDACQSHGAKSAYPKSRTCVYSFYPGKNLGCLGDGGCIVTHDDELAKLVRSLANYGQAEKYIHDYQGFNSRLDEIQAAVLRVKLRRLDADNQHRIDIAKYYHSQLSAMSGERDEDQLKLTTDGSHVYHIFPYLTNRRSALQDFLAKSGIHTQMHYPCPCHKQRAYYIYNNVILQNSEYLSGHELSLPISQIMRDEDVEFVIQKIFEFQQS